MKKLLFETEKDGFYGTYYENPKGSDCAVIGLFGDDPNDYMAKCGAKWLHKNGVNVLCMSPGKKNYSHVNFPLERIEMSIQWLKNNGNQKIGIMGMSTAGMDERLKERPHTCEYVPLVYEHGTHFVLPESLLRKALPVGLKFVMRFIFKAAKEYPNECEKTRKDIDRKLSAALKEWREE